MKKVTVKQCEDFIRRTFKELVPFKDGGIEVNYFWKMAEHSGLWERGTYNTPMSKALENITRFEVVESKGRYKSYSVFKLK